MYESLTKTPTVAVVGLGIGNSRSVANMLRSANVNVEFLERAVGLSAWTHVILPGVGKFDAVMSELSAKGWRVPMQEFAASGTGTLIGICLGAQVLGLSSEEGALDGLGLLPFHVRSLPRDLPNRVPFMGWDTLVSSHTSPEWLRDALTGRYYFSHSFFMDAPDDLVLARSSSLNVPSVVRGPSVLGIQFHPEKSHHYGRRLLTTLVSQ